MELFVVAIISIVVVGIIFGILLAFGCTRNNLSSKKSNRHYAKLDLDRYQTQQVTFSSMVENMKRLHAKPLAQTSVAIDVPRLASKITITDSQGVVVSGKEVSSSYGDQSYANEHTLKDVIQSLIRSLESDALSKSFETQFNDVFDYVDKQTPGDIVSFFRRLLPLVFPEDSLTLAVMKTLTQALFASAVEFMLPLRVKHRFHDGFTGWNITISIEEDNIVIRHVKGETSYVQDAFNFEWSLTYTVSKSDHQIKNVGINVFNVQFNHYSVSDQEDFYGFVDRINSEAGAVDA
ncbi:Ras guanine nucleotide exchange factor glfB-like C-terminal domain-containing protein [Entamoeba marina]